MRKTNFRFSQTAKDYQIAKQAVKDAEDVREDKVNKYKDAIASGTYNDIFTGDCEKMVSKYFVPYFKKRILEIGDKREQIWQV